MLRVKKVSLVAGLAVALLAAPSAFAAQYQIDPTHTNVLVQWDHFGFSKPSANFGQAKGTLDYDAANVKASKVSVELPLAGLTSFVPKLAEHLKGADFFDAVRFDKATFKSTRVEAAGENRLKVHGVLTIKGVSKPVVLDATLNHQGEHPMLKAQAIGFDATTVIKRSDFGLGAYAPAVSDEVSVRITTEAAVAK